MVEKPPCVVLEHTPEGDRAHFDWLIAPDPRDRDPDERVLGHLRCPERPDLMAPGDEMDVEIGEPHRWRYLTYEGPVSGDRGVVRRVAEGTCAVGDAMGRMILSVSWPDGGAVYEAEGRDGPRRRLRRVR